MVGDANRRGYRHLLDAFWDQCASHGIKLPSEEPVSAPAFCQARAKVSTAMLRHVLHLASSQFAETFDDLWRWRGRRVFAVDGSKFNLSRSHELDQHFGRPSSAYFPQATVSALVNVSSGIPRDVLIAPYASCERRLLLDHLDVLDEGDVVILDRGYPSHDVLRTLLARNIDFLVRVPASHTFEVIDTFRQSGGDDYRVVIQRPDGAGRDVEAVELRAVKLINGAGEESFYLTSLRQVDFSRPELAKLYRKRWEAEELYKLQKANYFDQRQFHARSAHGVEQEILAQEIYIVIARFLMATAAGKADAEYRNLSVKSAVLGLADSHAPMPRPPEFHCGVASEVARQDRQDPRQAPAWAGLAKTIIQAGATMGAERALWRLTALGAREGQGGAPPRSQSSWRYRLNSRAW